MREGEKKTKEPLVRYFQLRFMTCQVVIAATALVVINAILLSYNCNGKAVKKEDSAAMAFSSFSFGGERGARGDIFPKNVI